MQMGRLVACCMADRGGNQLRLDRGRVLVRPERASGCGELPQGNGRDTGLCFGPTLRSQRGLLPQPNYSSRKARKARKEREKQLFDLCALGGLCARPSNVQTVER